MNQKSLKLLTDINNAVIKLRGIYSAWAKKNGITYNEMLVLYTIRDCGFCTQKQICDSYLLPRQTINHVIQDMVRRELLELCPDHCTGREKAFVLSEKGQIYAAPLLESLNQFELQALTRIGCEALRTLADSVMTYNAALCAALEEMK